MIIQKQAPKPKSLAEFIALMAMVTSLGALSIDAMLPALPAITDDLAITDANRVQLIISVIMLGMGGGQLLFGPLADSIGRKRSLYTGLGIYICGSLVSLYAGSLTVMLAGRLIQGFGLASTRVVTMALVRDTFSGREMAKVMSFIMMVFIIVPVIAPSLGQLVLMFYDWTAIFALFIVLACCGLCWFSLRQPETLAPADRRPFRIRPVLAAFREVLGHRVVMFYTIAAGFVMGNFLTYLSASQSIFEHSFGITDDFPKYFALVAGSIGLASFSNSRLVMRFGMVRMIFSAIGVFIFLAILLCIVSALYGGRPPVGVFLLLAMPLFFSHGLLFGNLNAIAMQPVGHMAGLGAAVIGCCSTLISVPCAVIAGQLYHGSLTPFFAAYVLLAVIGLLFIVLAHRADPAAGH